MAMLIVLQSEQGNSLSEVVHDRRGVIALAIPDLADHASSCARFVDPYGDTIFNRLQASVLLEEWDQLKQSFVQHDAEKLWKEVRDLILRCSEEPHTYLKFVGD